MANNLLRKSSQVSDNKHNAGVAELADARDLKSLGPLGRMGSIPIPGTLITTSLGKNLTEFACRPRFTRGQFVNAKKEILSYKTFFTLWLFVVDNGGGEVVTPKHHR